MQNVPGQAPPCLESGIRRSATSHDQIPAHIQRRKDLTFGAKCLYSLLRSIQNMNIEPSYQDMADELGASLHSIVRWMKRLVELGLIKVWRRGQGLTNIATVVGMAIRSAIESKARIPTVRITTRSERRIEERGKKQRGTAPISYAQGRLGAVPAR